MAKGKGLTFEVTGLDALLGDLDKMPDKMTKGAERAVAEETHEVAEDMRENVPVDTGALQRGIQEEVDGLSGKAVSTAQHSWAVEGGTSKMPARPFAQPAAERSRNRFPGRVQAAVREELT